MNLFRYIKNSFWNTKRQIQTNSLDSLIWLVNVVPGVAGFSIRSDKVWVPFWIINFTLLFYVYGVGNFEYQWKHAEGAGDFIKSYVNISILILVANNSWWFLKKRLLLKATVKNIEENDRMSRRASIFEAKHEKRMRIIKRIILIFYGFNLTNAFCIYLPTRVDVTNSFSMTLCYGLEPLTVSPNREVCQVILGIEEFAIMTVALNFQALLVLLIAHTAVMYQMLSLEMMMLNDNGSLTEAKARAKERLPSLIGRHSLTLEVVNKLKSLYSQPIGVNFGTSAVCISLFFYLPLQEWLQFMPILVYSFLVFFLYCFLGQRLVNASEEFESSVYCCGWENFDLKEKRMVYVMLHQAQKPIELLAADIIPVNISTFATTLQAMFKFVTVVKV